MFGLNETIDPHEMLRLRDMLDAAGVEYECGDGFIGDGSWRTYSADFKVVDDRCVAGFSCALHQLSYGAANGLLELWAKGMDDPCGFLTADGVMGELRKAGLGTSNPLWCPLMGGKPCMGRECACAVYRYSHNVRTWKCGMVAQLADDEARNTILIEDERMYTNRGDDD